MDIQTFETTLAEMQIILTAQDLIEVHKKYMELAIKKALITNEDIKTLTERYLARVAGAYFLKSLSLKYDSLGKQMASVCVITPYDEVQISEAVGDGPLQAIFLALDMMFEQELELVGLDVQALSAGLDARAEAHIVVRNPKSRNRINTYAMDFDAIKACALAYLQAHDTISSENDILDGGN